MTAGLGFGVGAAVALVATAAIDNAIAAQGRRRPGFGEDLSRRVASLIVIQASGQTAQLRRRASSLKRGARYSRAC